MSSLVTKHYHPKIVAESEVSAKSGMFRLEWNSRLGGVEWTGPLTPRGTTIMRYLCNGMASALLGAGWQTDSYRRFMYGT